MRAFGVMGFEPRFMPFLCGLVRLDTGGPSVRIRNSEASLCRKFPVHWIYPNIYKSDLQETESALPPPAVFVTESRRFFDRSTQLRAKLRDFRSLVATLVGLSARRAGSRVSPSDQTSIRPVGSENRGIPTSAVIPEVCRSTVLPFLWECAVLLWV